MKQAPPFPYSLTWAAAETLLTATDPTRAPCVVFVRWLKRQEESSKTETPPGGIETPR